MKTLLVILLLVCFNVGAFDDIGPPPDSLTFRVFCDKKVKVFGSIAGNVFMFEGMLRGEKVHFPAIPRWVAPLIAEFFRDPKSVCGPGKLICQVRTQKCV